MARDTDTSVTFSDPSSGVYRIDERAELVTDMAFALHDAKNMACAIQASLEWLKMSCTPRPAEEIGETLEDLSDACRALSGILLDALRAARSGVQGLPLRRVRVDIGVLVREHLRRSRHRAEVAGVRVELEPAGEVFSELDPELTGRVLDNLIDNALKASKPGSTVSVGYGQFVGNAVITVADRGPGILAADQAKIFELFVAADGTPPESGTGVGLAFCRRVAEAHGGHLTVESAPGEGATFVFSLPSAM